MNRPMRLNGHVTLSERQSPFALFAFGAVLVCSLLLSGCAQFNQLMGTSAESTEAQPAPAQEPAAPATVTAPSQPASSPSTGSHSPDTKPARKAVVAPGQPIGPEPKQAPDKAVAEKEQSKKDKKTSVASDKKSAKKPAKPEAQPEDAFLPPVPLPSKPAAIGGSGG